MSLPAPFRSIVVKPAHRGRCYSLSLDIPIVYGDLRDAGGWAVWNRHTGRVLEFFPHTPNIHGWSNAKHLADAAANRLSGPHDFTPFELDSVP